MLILKGSHKKKMNHQMALLPHSISVPLQVKKNCKLQNPGSEGGGINRGSVATSTLSSQPKDNWK